MRKPKREGAYIVKSADGRSSVPPSLPSNPDPLIGSRWRTQGVTHTWKVDRIGHRFVWLRSTGAFGGELKVERSVWPGTWEPA